MSALDEAVSQRDKYRDALAEIASYHEHGRHSAITPAVLARKAEAALRNPVRNP